MQALPKQGLPSKETKGLAKVDLYVPHGTQDPAQTGLYRERSLWASHK